MFLRSSSSFLPRRLLNISEIPHHLRFNPFVMEGYRPLLSVGGCLKSLLYVHNETFNVYTHLIGALVLAAFLPEVTCWRLPLRRVSLAQRAAHGVASLSAWVGSVLYHLFMSHRAGERAYDLLLSFDVTCIWIASVVGTLNAVYAGLYCFEPWAFQAAAGTYLAVNAGFLVTGVRASDTRGRASSFLFLLGCRLLLYYVRAFHGGGGDPEAIGLMLQQDVLMCVGAILAMFFLPERLTPGTFDFLLNSHNLLHVLSMVGAYFMHRAVVVDFQWLEEQEDEVLKCLLERGGGWRNESELLSWSHQNKHA